MSGVLLLMVYEKTQNKTKQGYLLKVARVDGFFPRFRAGACTKASITNLSINFTTLESLLS